MPKPLTEKEVREVIRDELHTFLKRDKFVFDKLIQILDGREIQTGRTLGLKICTETDQKVAFYGTTPVIQQDAIAAPTGGTVIDTQSRSAIDSILQVIRNLGIISS